MRRRDAKTAYEQYRANLGRGILLGLEFLIGADIIATVTSPLTWESVGLLGAIILIRTLLSFSLETEIEGVAPWRRRDANSRTRRRQPLTLRRQSGGRPVLTGVVVGTAAPSPRMLRTDRSRPSRIATSRPNRRSPTRAP